MVTAGNPSSVLRGNSEAVTQVSRGQRRRDGQANATAKLVEAFALIERLEVSQQPCICASCRGVMNGELEARLDAVRPFLAAQIAARTQGTPLPSDSWLPKLLRDAALHAADGETLHKGASALRKCRKEAGLPSRPMSTDQEAAELKRMKEADEVAKDKTNPNPNPTYPNPPLPVEEKELVAAEAAMAALVAAAKVAEEARKQEAAEVEMMKEADEAAKRLEAAAKELEAAEAAKRKEADDAVKKEAAEAAKKEAVKKMKEADDAAKELEAAEAAMVAVAAAELEVAEAAKAADEARKQEAAEMKMTKEADEAAMRLEAAEAAMMEADDAAKELGAAEAAKEAVVTQDFKKEEKRLKEAARKRERVRKLDLLKAQQQQQQEVQDLRKASEALRLARAANDLELAAANARVRDDEAADGWVEIGSRSRKKRRRCRKMKGKKSQGKGGKGKQKGRGKGKGKQMRDAAISRQLAYMLRHEYTTPWANLSDVLSSPQFWSVTEPELRHTIATSASRRGMRFALYEDTVAGLCQVRALFYADGAAVAEEADDGGGEPEDLDAADDEEFSEEAEEVVNVPDVDEEAEEANSLLDDQLREAEAAHVALAEATWRNEAALEALTSPTQRAGHQSWTAECWDKRNRGTCPRGGAPRCLRCAGVIL